MNFVGHKPSVKQFILKATWKEVKRQIFSKILKNY